MDNFYELRRRITPFTFGEPLVEGVIISRPNRFIMFVKVNGEEHRCHCPTTGKIGNIKLEGRPVLVKPHRDTTGKSTWGTVEAISYDKPKSRRKLWIGINQNEANRYVEHFLRCGGFKDMLPWGYVEREQKLGNSRIDFRVGDTYVEVKTPVQVIERSVPDYIETWERKKGQLHGGDRLMKHFSELGNALGKHERCIALTCFLYPEDPESQDFYDDADNTGVYADADAIRRVVAKAEQQGLECWSAHFSLTPTEVTLLDYRRDDL